MCSEMCKDVPLVFSTVGTSTYATAREEPARRRALLVSEGSARGYQATFSTIAFLNVASHCGRSNRCV